MSEKVFKAIDDKKLTKTRRKVNAKSYKKRVYGLGGYLGYHYFNGGNSDGGDGGGGMGESLIAEIASGATPDAFGPSVLHSVHANILRNRQEEDAESSTPKKAMARQLFMSLVNRQDLSRQDIINAFVERLGVTESTAVSYYEKFAKEAGVSGKSRGEPQTMAAVNIPAKPQGMLPDINQQAQELSQPEEPPTEEPPPEDEDPNHAGTIRRVPGAHLVYKRRSPDGTFEELWVFKSEDFDTSSKIQQGVLDATDIPPKHTKSADGSQSYTITTMGNAQVIHIKGLPN